MGNANDGRDLARDTHSRTSAAHIALRVALGCGALYALYRECEALETARVWRSLQAVPSSRLMLAVAAAAGSFAALALIELLAVHVACASFCRVRRRLVVGTSFIANAFGQSIGLALLTGAAVRTRAYSRAGLDSLAVGRMTAFVTITSTLGLLTTSAIALLASAWLGIARPYAAATIPVGALLGVLVLIYVMWSIVGKKAELGIRRWTLPRPPVRVVFAQLALALLDWTLAGLVLYAFMPASSGFGLGQVLGAFAMAQIVAVTSHVPAGAGIFELGVMKLLTHGGSADAGVVAALVLFRLTYYVLPLTIAIVVASASEMRRRSAARITASRVRVVPTPADDRIEVAHAR